LLVVVILVGGVEILSLGAVGDEVGGVAALEAALGDLLLSLWNLCKARNFLTSRVISSLGCSHTAHQMLQPKKTR
jgi:hypothetical protein